MILAKVYYIGWWFPIIVGAIIGLIVVIAKRKK